MGGAGDSTLRLRRSHVGNDGACNHSKTGGTMEPFVSGIARSRGKEGEMVACN